MKTYTIGTSWKRLLAVSAILSAVLTGYSGAPLAATSAPTDVPHPGECRVTLGHGATAVTGQTVGRP